MSSHGSEKRGSVVRVISAHLKALVIYNIVYNLVDEQQRIQALADASGCSIWNAKGFTPQGLLEWQAVHHTDAQRRP